MADKGSLNDLGLGNEKLEGAEFDQIPENLGQSYPDPVQPGKYRFRFPQFGIGSAIWSVFDTTDYGKRIAALFEDDFELEIVQSPLKEYDGQGYRWRVTNAPRPRTKEKILVSDMDLVLRALGVTKRPANNKAYAAELVKLAGKEFSAEQEFSWRCDPNRPIYIDDGQGGTIEHPEGKTGCGARYYQRDVQKADGHYPIRITCSNPECGANIRAFGNLTGFKA